MWKKIKAMFKGVKDFFVSLFQNATNNVDKAIKKFGWKIVPIAFVAGYLLLMLPQLAVFTVIASFTSGIQDPILKFLAGLMVFAAMEFVLLTVAWIAVVVLGMPEMLRFACYVQGSYEKRLAEEEIREANGESVTVSGTYNRLKDHKLAADSV